MLSRRVPPPVLSLSVEEPEKLWKFSNVILRDNKLLGFGAGAVASPMLESARFRRLRLAPGGA
jgi:hypothetical protein